MPNIFVAMSFSPKFLAVLKTIDKAAEKAGVGCRRVDMIPQYDNTGKGVFDIHKAIFDEIDNSVAVIAELTGANANVAIEAKHALDFQVPVIIITQDNPRDLPFDLSKFAAIVYNNNDDGLEYLEYRLIERIKAAVIASKNIKKKKTQQPEPPDNQSSTNQSRFGNKAGRFEKPVNDKSVIPAKAGIQKKKAKQKIIGKNQRIFDEIMRGDYSNYEELTSLNAKTATELVKFPGSWLKLNGLTYLDKDTASKLAKFSGYRLSLYGLTALDKEIASELAKFPGYRLYLNGLTTLNKETASELAKFSGDRLSLYGLTTLNMETAAKLAKFSGSSLILSGLKSIGKKTAMKLSKFNGIISAKKIVKDEIEKYK